MGETIPAHLAGDYVYDGGSFGNVRLRVGEVQAVYYKRDARNISKKFVEYDVLVSHRSNGTAATKIYSHCISMDAFGGLADTYKKTFRPDKSASRRSSSKTPIPGDGSKVLLLCINGEQHNAVIVGGISDMNGPEDVEEDGHNLHWRFNGVDVTINKDGELVIEYQGAQKNDGTLADGVDEKSTGTTITFSKDGNVEVADAVTEGNSTVAKNLILLDHVNSKIVVTADKEVNVNAPKITHGGADATEPHLLGNKWKDLMGQLIDAITQLTVVTGVGTSTPPVNIAAFQQIKAQLGELLSEVVFTK